MNSSVWKKDDNQNFINLHDEIKEPIRRATAEAPRQKPRRGGKSVNLNSYRPFNRQLGAGELYKDFNSNLEIRNIEGAGRGVQTIGNIAVGQKIGEAKAFACVAEKSEEPYCIACKLQAGKFISCDKCDLVLFCSETCKNNVKDAHKFECGTNFHCIEFGENLDVKLALQMVFESLKIHRTVAELLRVVGSLLVEGRINPSPPTQISEQEHRFQCIMKLCADNCDTSYEGKVYSAYQLIMEFETIGKMFESVNHKIFLWHLLAHFMKVIKSNSFRIKQDGLELQMIFDTMSFFNHHCSPNAFHFLVRDKMIVISSRPIGPSEQVFICYDADFLSIKKSTEERRDVLKEKWNFDCACDRCKAGGGTSNDNGDEEITNEILDGVKSSKTLTRMELIIDREFKSGTSWSLEMGASCIKYFQLCMDQLNLNSKKSTKSTQQES